VEGGREASDAVKDASPSFAIVAFAGVEVLERKNKKSKKTAKSGMSPTENSGTACTHGIEDASRSRHLEPARPLAAG
jgi:hypothetical protein